MSDRSPVDGTLRSTALLCCLLGAGCAAVERAPPVSQPEPVATAPVAAAAPPAPVATVEPPAPASAPVAQVQVAPPPAAPAPAQNARPPAVTAGAGNGPKASGGTKAAPVVAPAKAPAPPAATVASPPAAAPKVAAVKPAAPPLDLAALETRLRETRAIGVMTKLSLKNQVDDLLDKFRAYYRRQAKTSLAELRRPYDMLLLKVLSLLQDSDPPLARDIVASREAIWGILADPQKFNEAKLMAGDTP